MLKVWATVVRSRPRFVLIHVYDGIAVVLGVLCANSYLTFNRLLVLPLRAETGIDLCREIWILFIISLTSD